MTRKALELGYRHVSRAELLKGPPIQRQSNSFQVDCAKVYGNEEESASAIRHSGLDRSKVFYTSKVPRTCMGYEKAKKAIAESIEATNIGYIDL